MEPGTLGSAMRRSAGDLTMQLGIFDSEGRAARARRIGLRLLSVLVILVAWEEMAPRMSGLLFPTVRGTMTALLELLVLPAFWRALWLSNQALLLGFLLAAIFGVSLGLWMGRSRTVERIAAPYLSILLVTPVSALIPLFIIATGLGLATRVLVVFTFACVVIVVTTRAGIRALDQSWIEMAISFGASERQIWSRVLLPGTLPVLMTALRLGLGRAIAGMVAAELLAMAVGVGRLVLDYQGNFDAAHVFATVLCVVAQAVALTEGAKYLERRLWTWRTAVGNR
ncbi:MAG: ABC transporter permease subunit [Chloroflexota bacterium]|nr:MAG: ABC transporter permease subunit [Chloroflexota bacterium]